MSTLNMKMVFNGHDREISEWPLLFKKVDPHFRVRESKFDRRELGSLRGAPWALIEAVWEG
jgi:hypothetical protein